MADIDAKYTENGLKILKDHLNSGIVRDYLLIGSAEKDDTELTEILNGETVSYENVRPYVITEGKIESSRIDPDGVLTFDLNLTTGEAVESIYIYACALMSEKEIVSYAMIHKIYMESKIRGTITYKVAVNGEAGTIIFSDRGYVLKQEFDENIKSINDDIDILANVEKFDDDRRNKIREKFNTVGEEIGNMSGSIQANNELINDILNLKWSKFQSSRLFDLFKMKELKEGEGGTGNPIIKWVRLALDFGNTAPGAGTRLWNVFNAIGRIPGEHTGVDHFFKKNIANPDDSIGAYVIKTLQEFANGSESYLGFIGSKINWKKFHLWERVDRANERSDKHDAMLGMGTYNGVDYAKRTNNPVLSYANSEAKIALENAKEYIDSKNDGFSLSFKGHRPSNVYTNNKYQGWYYLIDFHGNLDQEVVDVANIFNKKPSWMNLIKTGHNYHDLLITENGKYEINTNLSIDVSHLKELLLYIEVSSGFTNINCLKRHSYEHHQRIPITKNYNAFIATRYVRTSSFDSQETTSSSSQHILVVDKENVRIRLKVAMHYQITNGSPVSTMFLNFMIKKLT